MEIKYAKRAIKTLNQLDKNTKQRIREGINGIPLGDIKKLQGHKDLLRLRIGDWRVVFSYPDNNTILIERISPRGEIYKGGY